MKLQIILLILLSLININCTSQKKTEIKNKNSILKQIQQIEKIQLLEQTRGTNRIFTFQPNSLHISLNGTDTQQELSTADWENIVKQAILVDLSKISTYTSPTTGRYSDSALSSTVIITAAGKTYESSSFDAGIPPKELEGLYVLLRNKLGAVKTSAPKFR